MSANLNLSDIPGLQGVKALDDYMGYCCTRQCTHCRKPGAKHTCYSVPGFGDVYTGKDCCQTPYTSKPGVTCPGCKNTQGEVVFLATPIGNRCEMCLIKAGHMPIVDPEEIRQSIEAEHKNKNEDCPFCGKKTEWYIRSGLRLCTECGSIKDRYGSSSNTRICRSCLKDNVDLWHDKGRRCHECVMANPEQEEQKSEKTQVSAKGLEDLEKQFR